MNQSFCSVHGQEEEKYICIHSDCLKKVNNKLCCMQCFYALHSNEKKIKLDQHKFLHISELESTAIHNYQNLKIHFNDEIQKNQQLNRTIEERLQAILHSLSNWQNNQKKMFNDIAENSSQVLNYNILKADNLMKNPSLDTFIYFSKLNLLDTYNQNKDIRDHSMRQLEYQLKQIEQKRDILINQISFIQREHFLNFAQIDYQIEFNNLNDFYYEKCQKHLCKKKMLCTHPNCLNNNPQQLQCIQCIPEEHQEHQQGKYVKNLALIQKEQSEKIEQIEHLKKKLNSDIKESIDKNLLKINESQQNYYYNYEKQKEKAIFLEQQQQIEFLNSDTPIFIFDKIDSKLLKTSKDQIDLYYQSLYHNFDIKFSGIFSNKVNDDLKLCTELDFNSKLFFQYIINLENEIELLQGKLQVYKKQIESQTLNHSKIELENPTQKISIQNLQTSLEKSIATLSSITQTNSSSQTVSINNLKSSLEKSIATLSSLTQTNSSSQTISINNLKSSFENEIASLSSLTQRNQQQSQNQVLGDVSEFKTLLKDQALQITNISGRQKKLFIILPIVLLKDEIRNQTNI